MLVKLLTENNIIKLESLIHSLTSLVFSVFSLILVILLILVFIWIINNDYSYDKENI